MAPLVTDLSTHRLESILTPVRITTIITTMLNLHVDQSTSHFHMATPPFLRSTNLTNICRHRRERVLAIYRR